MDSMCNPCPAAAELLFTPAVTIGVCLFISVLILAAASGRETCGIDLIKSGLFLLTKAVIFLARSVVIFDLVNEISLSLFGVVSSEFVAELLSAVGVGRLAE